MFLLSYYNKNSGIKIDIKIHTLGILLFEETKLHRAFSKLDFKETIALVSDLKNRPFYKLLSLN